MIHEMLQKILKCVVPFKSEVFLLNIMSTIHDKDKKHIILHIIIEARLVYAQMWKCNNVLVEGKLKDKIYEVAGHIVRKNGRRESREN